MRFYYACVPGVCNADVPICDASLQQTESFCTAVTKGTLSSRRACIGIGLIASVLDCNLHGLLAFQLAEEKYDENSLWFMIDAARAICDKQISNCISYQNSLFRAIEVAMVAVGVIGFDFHLGWL